MLDRLGWTLAFLLPVAMLAVAAAKYWADAGWWFVIPIGVVLLSLLIAGTHAARRWWSLARAAGEADAQLGLKDELRSAIELDENQGQFARIAVQTGEQHAADLHAGSVRFTLRRTPWMFAGLALTLTIVAGIWMPQQTTDTPRPSAMTLAQADRAARALDTAAQAIDQTGEAENPRIQEALDELSDLEEELLNDPARAEDAPARAAAKLDQLAEELEQDADQQDQLRNELADRIAEHKANTPKNRTSSEPSPLDEFADALTRQDYESAREAMENLREQSEQMSDAERENLRDQLEQLANAIEPDNAKQPEIEPESTDTPNTQENSDPSTESHEQPQSSESADEPQQDETPEPTESERLSEALREEAERLKKQAKQNEQANEQGERNPNQPSQDPGQRQTEDAEPKDSESGENTKEQNQSPTGNPQSEQPQEIQQQPANNEQSTGEKQQQPDPSSTEQSQSESETKPQEQQPTNEGRQEEQAGDPQQPEPGNQPTVQPNDRTGERPSEGQGDQQDKQSLDEVLREMETTKEQNDGQRRDAEELRRAARELIDPEQNPSEQRSPGSKDGQNNQPSPLGDQSGEDGSATPSRDPGDQPEYIPVDGRSTDRTGDARKAGEWYAPDDPNATPTDRARSADRLRKAADAAKRAVDDQRVPRKYRDLIRDVYKRVEKRADSIQPTEAVTPGKDAEPSGTKP